MHTAINTDEDEREEPRHRTTAHQLQYLQLRLVFTSFSNPFFLLGGKRDQRPVFLIHRQFQSLNQTQRFFFSFFKFILLNWRWLGKKYKNLFNGEILENLANTQDEIKDGRGEGKGRTEMSLCLARISRFPSPLAFSLVLL
jgi:hypothetical protein